jgi:hypothetical protein
MHSHSYTGVDEKGVLRSLSLPNLSAVTRQGTKDYFDNSWTLFEMLFAGLKGDEPFYRCVVLRLSLFTMNDEPLVALVCSCMINEI